MIQKCKIVLLGMMLIAGSCADHQDFVLENYPNHEETMISNIKAHILKEMPTWEEKLNFEFIVREEDKFFVVEIRNPDPLVVGGGALFYMDKLSLEVVEVWGTQ